MAVVICASATGSPGVTTTALGLALTWPRDVLLADCDRDPAQSVQAGYLRGLDLSGRGLLSISRAHREGHPLAPAVWQEGCPLSDENGCGRRFLPGFTHPGSASLFHPVWTDLGQAFHDLGASGADVIVDAGRIGRDGLPDGLVISADAVLVFTRSSLRSLAALRLHLPALNDALNSAVGHAELALAVVGAGRPYSVKEITAQFRHPVWLNVAYDPAAAAVLSDGEPEGSQFRDGAFIRSLKAGAAAITDHVAESMRNRKGRYQEEPT